MKLKIVSMLIVVIILIMQLPAFADTILPEPPEGAYQYHWVVFEDSEGKINLVCSSFTIYVTMNEEKIKTTNFMWYKLVNGDWIYQYSGKSSNAPHYHLFENIYKSNRDIAYEDGSDFFFRAEESQPSIPNDEENGIWENLEEFFSWFNPDAWLDNIRDSVQESVGLLTETTQRIINFLNPQHEDFFLRVAFIPSAGYMEEFRTDIKAIFDSKFSFINEIRDFLAFIFSSPIIDNPGPPQFQVNLPGGKWGAGSVQVIDFSMFADYRIYIINFIRVFLWIPFLIKLYKRLPSIVY